MTITSYYYSVSVNISPFKFGGAKEVGCYSTRDTAERVARFIRLAFEQKVSGGIDIGIQAYQSEMIHTSQGWRLKETPDGCITSIHETLSETETNRLLKSLPILLKSKLIQPKSDVETIDLPKYILEGHYHCVVLDFQPFDKSHRLFVGYYQSKQTANSVSDYIKQTHYHEKIGCGFNMSIETYEGKFVQYESGKLYIKIGEKDHEILSSCDMDEFIKISKSVNQSIDKWSRSENGSLDKWSGS